jgi:5'-methylthioadenosine phosphorylase
MPKNNIKVGIIGGSGLDDPKLLETHQEIEVNTPYGPPASKLSTGKYNGVEVVVLARHGLDHNIIPTKVPYQANIQALSDAGCTHILATTACGSLKEEIKPGDIVLADQFIDFTKHRSLTFHEDKVVHTPMAEPFCSDLRKTIAASATKLQIKHHTKGTIVTIEGPRFSTKAESHMFRAWGADVINMSTVPEVILAREAGICYQAIAMATDYDCWREGEEPVTWEMVQETMRQNADNVKKLILSVIPGIQDNKCEQCKN